MIADRARENRSQLVFTTARGRDAIFSHLARKQARPQVATPTAREAGIDQLEIIIDGHEHYPYRFAGKAVRTLARALPCGDHAITLQGRLVAAVERKSLADLIASLTSGRLRYALGELAGLLRAAVVVENRYSQVFKSDRVRPALIIDGLAECQIRWPEIAIVFCETRPLAGEWTYRYLAAAHHWATTEPAATARITAATALPGPPPPPPPSPRSEPGPAPMTFPSRNENEADSRPKYAKRGTTHTAPEPNREPNRPPPRASTPPIVPQVPQPEKQPATRDFIQFTTDKLQIS